MALRADEIIDRRQLRRKLTFWRVPALVVAAIAVVGGGDVVRWRDRRARVDHIAKVRIEGTITEDEELMERLNKMRKPPR